MELEKVCWWPQFSQEDQPCRCSMPILQKSWKQHNPSCQVCMTTSWKKKKKSDIIWLYILFICSTCWRVSLPWPCMVNPLSKVFQETTPWDGILLNTLQASSMLPHLAYMSKRLLLTRAFDTKSIPIICLWAHLPSSSPSTLAQAFRTPTKVIVFGSTPSCCIWWNKFNATCPSPHFTFSNIMAVHETNLTRTSC